MRIVCAWSILAVRALAAEATYGPPSITVGVYNFAALTTENLPACKREASRIFERAGVHAVFIDCALSATDLDRYPGCTSVQVALRIRPGLPPREFVSSSVVFGFAFLSGDGRPGTLADVYAGGAEVLAKGSKKLEPLMLGALMAHEIGHLLLGTNNHSAAGLMRSPWRASETEKAAQGCLWFLGPEARKMRANCHVRRGGERR